MGNISSRITPLAVSSLAHLANSYAGGLVLKRYGPQVLERLLLSFLEDPNPEREAGIRQMAGIAGNLMIDIFSDPNRPGCVKQGVLNPIEAFAGARIRELLRQQGYAVPAFVVISPTRRCNLKCYGCYANSGKEGASLSLDELNRTVNEIKRELGIHFIVISGGEPFLMWPELYELAKLHPDVSFMVYTNGTLIDGKVIADLRRLGNVSPCLSVEGFREATDGRRGKGYFHHTIRLMEALKRAGIIFGFSGTVTSQNAETIASEDFIRACIEWGCTFGWYFLYIPIGRNPDYSLMPSDEQRALLIEVLAKVRAKRWPIFVADFWNDGRLTKGCIAARLYCHISPEGNVEPCVFMTIAAGNIRDRSVKEIFCDSAVCKKIRELQQQVEDPEHRPCLIIDNPSLAQQVWRTPGAMPTPCTPPGFFDDGNAIRKEVERVAKRWKEKCGILFPG